MNLRQLQYFLAVVEARSFIKAARTLNAAQPSLSRSIKNLEEELQVSLLIRSAREVTPTYAGEELTRRAKLIINEFHRTKEEIVAIAKGKKGRA